MGPEMRLEVLLAGTLLRIFLDDGRWKDLNRDYRARAWQRPIA